LFSLGHPVKRSVYALLFGTTASAVCYPHRALDIATTGYYHTTDSISQLFTSTGTPTTTERVTKELKREEAVSIEEPVDLESTDLQETVKSQEEATEEYNPYQTTLKEVSVIPIEPDESSSKDVTSEIEFDNAGSENAPVVEGDHGQSNPDDADMYSTRS